MKVSESICIQRYKCLMQDCELHCCGGWRIELNESDVEKWKANAPQLLRFIEEKYDSDGTKYYTMKKGDDNCCVMKDGGPCTIQRDYGEEYLPNLCAYFPHLYKKFNEHIFSTATVACPAVIKCIMEANKDDWEITDYDRKYTKNDIADYTVYANGVNFENLKKVHYRYLSLFDDESLKTEEIIMILLQMCRIDKDIGLQKNVDNFDLNFKTAKEILDHYKQNNESVNSCFKILDTMQYMQITRITRPELNAIFDSINEALGIEGKIVFNAENINASIEKYDIIRNFYKKDVEKHIDKYMRNIMKGWLNNSFFPVGCLLSNQYEEMVFFAFFYLFTRLTLMCGVKSEQEAQSPMTFRRIASIISRTFYGASKRTTFKAIKEKNWLNSNNLEKALLYF